MPDEEPEIVVPPIDMTPPEIILPPPGWYQAELDAQEEAQAAPEPRN